MKANYPKTSLLSVVFLTLALMFLNDNASAQTNGLKADLRSSAAVLPSPILGGGVLPTAPAGGVLIAGQPWVCDASLGFTPVISAEPGASDPFLAMETPGNIKLPISSTTVPATCGQSAFEKDGFAYVTQAVVDTKNTPSTARGVLRVALSTSTGAYLGAASYIATTAGLDGNQPTATAIGPDGKLYVGFLKSGNIKRIITPDSGTAQAAESVGNTPQGHAARAFAFVGNDLYIASVDALSVIHNATSTTCTGGCNAVTIADGFAGLSHTGIASDGVTAVYFAVAGSASTPGNSQVWRYTPSNSRFSFVSSGGIDKNGTHASSFLFGAGKTNLLMIDATGNLWIGDDPSNNGTTGAGRLWTVNAGPLASLPVGSPIAGTNLPAILNALTGPWLMGFTRSEFQPTFNANGTFTATITSTQGAGVTTVSGTWTLTPPLAPQPFTNPQGQLTFTDTNGVVLFSATFLQTNLDMLTAFQPWSGSLGSPISGVLSKATP